MEHLFFFLKDKQRFKFLLKSILIGMPIIIVAGLLINYFEDRSSAQGTPNENGGMDYYYRSNSGASELPQALSSLVPIYPNGQITYYNCTVDSTGRLDGIVTVFTKDNFTKVKAFYKPEGAIDDEDESRLKFSKKNQTVIINTETIYDDDPFKDRTKFRICFDNPK